MEKTKYAELCKEYSDFKRNLYSHVKRVLNEIVELDRQDELDGYQLITSFSADSPWGESAPVTIHGITQDLEFELNYDESGEYSIGVENISIDSLFGFLQWIDSNEVLREIGVSKD